MATSVVNELVVWNNTTATEVSRATGTGAVYMTSGVYRVGHTPIVPWASGNYYDALVSYPAGNWGAGAITSLRLYACPVFVPNTVTISEFGINVTTLAASGLARIGVYAMGTDGKPGAIVWQGATTLDTSTTGEKTFTGLTQELTGGTYYWFALVFDNGTNQTHIVTASNIATGFSSHSSTTKLGITYFKTLASLVLPDPFGTPTGTLGTLYRMSARVA